MGLAQEPLPVKLFIAFMYDADTVNPEDYLQEFKRLFGNIDFFYGPIDFSWTEYYASEMGNNLKKIYVTFENPIDRTRLVDIKLQSNATEARSAVENNRVVNIDPGYIARDKFVLASTKDFYHRLYLGNGIFGEVTLHYRKGCFRYFNWTFPDYRDQGFIDFIEKVRARFVHDLRS